MDGQPRPTTAPGRVDVSAPASGTSAEAALFGAYRNARTVPRYRREMCMCGVEIRAETGWEHAAVEDHVATETHQEWSRWFRATYQ